MQGSNHSVLVTGGTRGIGLALARKFRDAGNHVAVSGRDLDALAKRSAEGFETFAADLSISEDVEQLILAVKGAMPNLSVLVNNAGVQFNGEFGTDIGPRELEAEVTVNATAPLRLIAGLLPVLRGQPSAAIVNITSVLAIQPKQDAPVYCATKAFMASFSRSLRYQLGGSGVAVFDIMPPLVDTDMTVGRGAGKISPDRLANEFWAAWLTDQTDVPIGKAKALKLINRLSPWLARKIVRARPDNGSGQ